VLERATETGAVGLAALAALAVAVVVTARRKLRETRAAADSAARVAVAAGCAALMALAGVGVTGFPLEMPGTLLLAGIALGVVAGTPAGDPDDASVAGAPPAWRLWLGRTGMALGAGLALVSVVRSAGEGRASYFLAVGERALRGDHGPAGAREAAPALEKARAAAPGEFLPWLRTAQASLKLRRVAESEAAARRALALEPYSPNAWAALAAAELSRDPRAARGSAERALALLRENPLALFVLARAAAAGGDAPTAGDANDDLQALSDPRATDQKTAATARELLQLDGLR